MYAIARELDTNCRELIRIGRNAGLEFRSHLSILKEHEEKRLKLAHRLATDGPAPAAPALHEGAVAVLAAERVRAAAATASATAAVRAKPKTGLRKIPVKKIGSAIVSVTSNALEPLVERVAAKRAEAADRPRRGVGAPPGVGVLEEGAGADKRGAHGKGRKGVRRFDFVSDYDAGRRGGAATRGRRRFGRQQREPAQQFVRPEKVEIQLPATLKDVSAEFGIRANTLIQEYFIGHLEQFPPPKITDFIDEARLQELGAFYDIAVTVKREQDTADHVEEELLKEAEAQFAVEDSTESTRPPIVTILGHVDHGKTTLLDKIRNTSVAASEAGGITQHIGAYSVESAHGQVTFIDTPGHQAFTKMRMRGAQATDIAVLVVAADDGVMPTTKEALAHALAAEVMIVVAITKIDKPDANIERVKAQLAEHSLAPMDWGGETEVIPVSGYTGDGVDTLVETLALLAETMGLTSHPNRHATGVVLEARKDPREGVTATLLVRDGRIRPGDIVIAGEGHGRVRAMQDHRGDPVDEAGPSTPVKVLGLDEVPMAGDSFFVTHDLSKTKLLAGKKRDKARMTRLIERNTAFHGTDLMDRVAAARASEVGIVIKADTQGSVEVLKEELGKLAHEEVRVTVLHAAVGGITETDVDLAAAARKEPADDAAVVLGFHVLADDAALAAADVLGMRDRIRTFRVIYELIDFVKNVMEGELAPEEVEKSLGHAEVRKVFRSSKSGAIAGLIVTRGTIARAARVRIYRDKVEISGGDRGYGVASLRRFQEDVKEVKDGFECGITIDGYDDVKDGDTLEFFMIEEQKRTLVL